MFSYLDFLSAELKDFLLNESKNVDGIAHLKQVGDGGGLENLNSLRFLVNLNNLVESDLENILKQRIEDRRFIDERTKALYHYNSEAKIDVAHENYKTVIGLEDHKGRIVWGPLQKDYWKKTNQANIAPIPDYLQGEHVTLFGPPESEKMCINAMNAYHRRLKDEPKIVEELLKTHTSVPKWGADDEDSKTPLRSDLISSGENLSKCFTKDISISDSDTNKKYELAADHLALPIKRFPGLAMPCPFLFYKEEPIPLHLYDFALHFYKHWDRPEALVFYVPKLENEEEAHYIKKMISAAEELILKEHPEYKIGSVRLMIVLENPRAIFRTHEIIDELYPYFAGASLGWHDFLASTARLFKEDGNYRIPIKADPDIVIKYIKASHEVLANVVGPRGGIKVGGMYGILPLSNDLKSASFQLTIKGYIRDVVTQMKRKLNGFWVAHPDFVRIGLALVEAWKIYSRGNKKPLENLVSSLLIEEHRKDVLEFIENPDIESLNQNDPRYPRSLIVADLKTSSIMSNSDPEEIRYNVFQSLQYLCDWLCGNGCVALPAQINGVAVRIMDDLATAERSRWEVWHEIHHQRVSINEFIKIAFEELNFIRKDLSDGKKIVQVKWNEESSRWYPVAFKIMIQLMSSKNPPEFATELLIPFTIDKIRNSANPWDSLIKIDSKKYALEPEVERLVYYFEKCGHLKWATQMAAFPTTDLKLAKTLIDNFDASDIIEAAQFHGNIGEAQKSLDTLALKEQSLVAQDSETVKKLLLKLGAEYLNKFSFKFLISAQNKTSQEILKALEARMQNSKELEIQNARKALYLIAEKRMLEEPLNNFQKRVNDLLKRNNVKGAQIALSLPESNTQSLCFGLATADLPVNENTLFEIASLSKSVASAFAIEYFKKKNIPLETPINSLLSKTSSKFRIRASEDTLEPFVNSVNIKHLLSHEALNMHYVNGIPANRTMPRIEELLEGNAEHQYPPIRLIAKPGSEFHYSGAGFIVLEHLIEALESDRVQNLTKSFLEELKISQFSFEQNNSTIKNYAHAYNDLGQTIEGTRKCFPSFAAGAMSNANDVLNFIQSLSKAYSNYEIHHTISHDTAVEMLFARDKGSVDFMGAKMGLGVFVAEAGENKIMLHQGANDGFRALFLYCYDGPDKDKGFVALCNSENQGVQFIAEVAQEFLKTFKFSGVNFELFNDSFDYHKIKEEERVNRGYSELVFSAFIPNLPNEIKRSGPKDPLSEFNKLRGAKIVSCTNQKFARAENLISDFPPSFDPTLFEKQGKTMDSWESARHSERGYEELILELSTPTQFHYALISTAYHFGNQVSEIQLSARANPNSEWQEILPRTKLDGHSIKRIQLNNHCDKVFSLLKLSCYPDGGLSRLQIFSSNLPGSEKLKFQSCDKALSEAIPEKIPQSFKPLTLPLLLNAPRPQIAINTYENIASAEAGAKILSVTNQHYGHADNVLSPYSALHMFDGFESARSREPNHREEIVIELSRPGIISKMHFDFSFFVNNNPSFIEVHALNKTSWIPLIQKSSVKAFAANVKVFHVTSQETFSQIKVFVYPDGGINRIKVFSKI